MTMSHRQRNNGFTLVELIAYVALTSLMFSAINSFVFLVIEERSRNIVINEVEQQGSFALQKIMQRTRNSDEIVTPGQGSSDTILELTNTDFELNSGIFQMIEGGSPVDLTNSRVVVSDFQVTNLSLDNTPGSIQVEFLVTYDNPDGKAELNYSKMFYGAASLR